MIPVLDFWRIRADMCAQVHIGDSQTTYPSLISELHRGQSV